MRIIIAAVMVAFSFSGCGGGEGEDTGNPVGSVYRAAAATLTTRVVSCVNNAVWSNPATFSTAYQNCVAPIGVQTLIDPSANTLQDKGCAVTAGEALSESCRAEVASGTIRVSEDASVIVDGHRAIWLAYLGVDSSSNLALLDSVTLIPVAVTLVPGSLKWTIGNTEGLSISSSVGGLLRGAQVSWNGISLALKCYSNC